MQVAKLNNAHLLIERIRRDVVCIKSRTHDLWYIPPFLSQKDRYPIYR